MARKNSASTNTVSTDLVSTDLDSTDLDSTDLDSTDSPLPAHDLWNGPMAWVGSPPRPAQGFWMEFPPDAVFVRGEVRLTVSIPTGPGMTSQSQRNVPGLIRLMRGTPTEVHLIGPDGQCWTYQRSGNGKRSRWRLLVSPEFPATQQAVENHAGVDYVVVVSMLPQAGSGRHVSFAIDDLGRGEDFSKSVDPDCND
jgi:hypothetical protein